MSSTAQLFAIVVALVTGFFIVRLVRSGQVRVKYSLLWLLVGSAMLVLAISPSLLDRVSAMLGISYGPATLFVAAIMLLLLVAMHYSWELSRLEERTRVLAEEIAMLRADKHVPVALPESPHAGTAHAHPDAAPTSLRAHADGRLANSAPDAPVRQFHPADH